MKTLEELMALADSYAAHSPFQPERRIALESALRELIADAERLQFLEDETMKGMAPNLVFDDDGNWAVSYSGMQPMPRGDGKGYGETANIICTVDPNEWSPSIRAAIDAARINKPQE